MVNNKKLTLFFYYKTNLWLIGLFLVILVLKFLLLPVFENILQIEENTISMNNPQIYSSDRVYEILTNWGESGRFKQFWFHITWDLLFPIVYFFFIGFLISWLTKRAFKQKSSLQNFCLVSLVAAIDLLENISLFLLILVYPSKIDTLCWFKTGFTLIKYYLFGPAILFALVFSTIYAVKNKFKIQA